MINEQEQAIAKIQQTLNHCIQETVNMLEDAIGRKTEVLPDEEMAELERSEYIRAVDELADLYSRFPAVRSLKQYMHLSDFLWESTFIESLSKDEKRKWFHSQNLATYTDFCKDNTVFDEAFPYFSVIHKVVVNERYAQYLQERNARRNSAKEIDTAPNAELADSQGTAIVSVPLSDIKKIEYTFESNLTDEQVALLVDCANEVRLFKGDTLTFEQMKSVLDCRPLAMLRPTNNRLLAFFFDQLSNRNHITEKWQAVIARYQLFLSSQKNTPLNQSDISTAVNNVRDMAISGKYARIEHCIRNLKSLEAR